jgi:chaperonin GroES
MSGQPVKLEIENPSGIQPVEYNLVVRPEKVADKTAGGLHIPDTIRDRDQYGEHKGTILAVSPMAFSFEEWPQDMPKPQPGQRIVFIKYAGTLVKGGDGEDYRVMKDKDVLAVME